MWQRLEGSPSWSMACAWKAHVPQGTRGFKSHPLRHYGLRAVKTALFLLFMPILAGSDVALASETAFNPSGSEDFRLAD